MLRMIAGLEEVTSGSIFINGVNVTRLHPAKRRIAMVFQSYALYPHLTVRQNIAFSLSVAGAPQEVQTKRADEIAALLQLDHLMDRKPAQLSGGQRQRVAIGRALAREPEVFLFDEPLSNLDALLRVQMRIELAKLHKTLGDHDDLRHPRPGRGDDAGRPHRRARPRRHRADRRAAGALRQAGQQVRRLVHRLADHELSRRHAE